MAAVQAERMRGQPPQSPQRLPAACLLAGQDTHYPPRWRRRWLRQAWAPARALQAQASLAAGWLTALLWSGQCLPVPSPPCRHVCAAALPQPLRGLRALRSRWRAATLMKLLLTAAAAARVLVWALARTAAADDRAARVVRAAALVGAGRTARSLRAAPQLMIFTATARLQAAGTTLATARMRSAPSLTHSPMACKASLRQLRGRRTAGCRRPRSLHLAGPCASPHAGRNPTFTAMRKGKGMGTVTMTARARQRGVRAPAVRGVPLTPQRWLAWETTRRCRRADSLRSPADTCTRRHHRAPDPTVLAALLMLVTARRRRRQLAALRGRTPCATAITNRFCRRAAQATVALRAGKPGCLALPMQQQQQLMR
jgi:hypothetical protein